MLRLPVAISLSLSLMHYKHLKLLSNHKFLPTVLVAYDEAALVNATASIQIVCPSIPPRVVASKPTGTTHSMSIPRVCEKQCLHTPSFRYPMRARAQDRPWNADTVSKDSSDAAT